MANPVRPLSAIQVVKFIGKRKFQHSLIVKCSDNINPHLEKKADKIIGDERHLELTQNECMLMEGDGLNIEVHQKRSQLWKPSTRERGSEEGPMRKAKIKFNDLQRHLSSKTDINSKFEVTFDDPIPELQLWLVIESCDIDLNTVDSQIKNMVTELDELQSALHCSASASDAAGMVIDLGTAISKLNPVTHAVFSCIEVVYKHVKTQEETHQAMKSLANSIQELYGQLKRLNEVPKSDQLHNTMKEFPDIMEEVVIFIRRWLTSFKYIFVDSQKEKAIELKDKLDAFKDKFDRNLAIDIRVEQATMAKNAKTAADKESDDLRSTLGKKELDDLVSALERIG